jgi:hypothetical protein
MMEGRKEGWTMKEGRTEGRWGREERKDGRNVHLAPAVGDHAVPPPAEVER